MRRTITARSQHGWLIGFDTTVASAVVFYCMVMTRVECIKVL